MNTINNTCYFRHVSRVIFNFCSVSRGLFNYFKSIASNFHVIHLENVSPIRTNKPIKFWEVKPYLCVTAVASRDLAEGSSNGPGIN